jgi:hypothetical protein
VVCSASRSICLASIKRYPRRGCLDVVFRTMYQTTVGSQVLYIWKLLLLVLCVAGTLTGALRRMPVPDYMPGELARKDCF